MEMGFFIIGSLVLTLALCVEILKFLEKRLDK